MSGLHWISSLEMLFLPLYAAVDGVEDLLTLTNDLVRKDL